MAIPEEGFTSHDSNWLARRTVPNCHIDIIAENSAVANNSPKENAATFAEVNGVKTCVAIQNQLENDSPKRRRNAMSKWAKDAHKRIAKCIGFALTLGTERAWAQVSDIMAARLSEKERAAVAYAALESLDPDVAYQVASLALYGVLHGEVAA